MRSSAKVVLVALAAGALGVAASLMTSGPGPLLRSEPGQRLLGAALSASAPAPPAGVSVATRGERVAAISVRDPDGNRVEIPGRFAGRPLLVNVWASWCAPCLKEMPELQRFATQQGADGVQVVGIALDEPDAVAAFLRRVPVSYPILLDAPGPADAGVRLGNPRGVLPYSALISADGRLLKQRIGPFDAGEIDAWTGD
ncbi:TlpA family protein disulfide reductase [Luteimonas sp. 50]|uniref:TlpA family protein disulfide reductase n=1 Tax=Cognatiluteimonas sedimenti TaxID=2927791 RepID=A0ABT0A3Q5_9GAMM|nr:TlpA disulfide reductase family protein [Lysobacter sedimenti]MCJ0825615.1 TlpA family protein disulfide reductase [Lysobacter sedimenti]